MTVPTTIRTIPAARMRHALLAVDKIMDRNGLLAVLRQAQLERYITAMPADSYRDHTHGTDLAMLVAAIERFYGRGARGQLQRIGWAVFEQLLHSKQLRWQVLRLSRPFLSEHQRQQRVLHLLADYLAAPDGGVRVEQNGTRWNFADGQADDCTGRGDDCPDSFLTVGMLRAALHWATGRNFDVTQISNRAHGADESRFELCEMTEAFATPESQTGP